MVNGEDSSILHRKLKDGNVKSLVIQEEFQRLVQISDYTVCVNYPSPILYCSEPNSLPVKTGEDPRQRPIMDETGKTLNSTTKDLLEGSTKRSYQTPGYTGYIPHVSHVPCCIPRAAFVTFPSSTSRLRTRKPTKLAEVHSPATRL
eukprot:gb/GECG01014268.1/.p1 GENE.gb/GECG01014268.1/~~gb/GECG01014268.1/.p1  ORF type:complete len:146 (+),score=8.81 gb/GECG01014268.1/:1-438(+)